MIFTFPVAVTRDDKIVVTDRKKKMVKLYDVTGQCIQVFGDEYSFIDEIEYRPHGVAVNSRGQFIVTDTSINSCKIYRCVCVLFYGCFFM